MNNKNISLINCTMCDKLISPNASFCPSCGEPMNIQCNIYEEDHDSVDLILLSIGSNNLPIIKLLQAVTKLDISTINSLINNIPVTILKNIDSNYANMLKVNFEKIGASTRVESHSYALKKHLLKLSEFHHSQKVLDEHITRLYEFYNENGTLLVSIKQFNEDLIYNLYTDNGVVLILKDKYELIKQSGVEVIYDHNGNLVVYIEYKNSKKHGKCLHYSDKGNLVAKIDYKDDKYHGRYFHYNDTNGKISSEASYIDGKKHGKTIYYDSDGNISSEVNYIAGEMNGKTTRYSSGNISSEMHYVDGKKHGESIIYAIDGTPSLKIKYINDVQVSREFLTALPPFKPHCSHNENNSTPTLQIKCPTCNSIKVSKISIGSKAGSAILFGVFSLGKISKTFECKNCGYKW